MSGFLSSYSQIAKEVKGRENGREGVLDFGVEYLNDSMIGILKNDLILVGAGSGAGKTQFCANVAKVNVEKGKRVHYIALEAEWLEIERRIKYQMFAKHFFNDQSRPKVRMNFQSWMVGDFIASCGQYEIAAAMEFEEKYKTLFTFYKSDKFDVQDLIETVCACEDETDLIILDHVHYMDFDDDKNENKAIKEIAKTARMLALEKSKPLILVSHIRKRDRANNDFAPGLEEFHGSSDLYKIATKAITLGPGRANAQGQVETYFRIVKNRFEGSVTRYIGQCFYNAKEGNYEKKYFIGDAYQSRDSDFNKLDMAGFPEWATNYGDQSGSNFTNVKGASAITPAPRRENSFQARQRKDLE